MARPELQEWPRIRRRKNPGGSVSYLVDVSTSTNRERLFFKSKQEAEVFAAQKKIERQNHGLASFEMPEAIRAEAARLWRRLQDVGVTLTEAGDFYFLHHQQKSVPKTVSETVAEMVQKRRNLGRSDGYMRVLELVLKNFAKTFGEREIHTVVARDIEDWLTGNPEWKPRTQLNYMRELRGLWNYAIKRGYAAFNPLNALEAPTVPSEAPGIFSPAQAEAILMEAAKPKGNGMVAYIAIGLFAGLRSAEIERLDWSEIDLEVKLIEVTAKKAKTRQRRHVTISNNLALWLAPFKKPSGPVAPKMSRLDLQLVGIGTRAGVEDWPKNGLRHSFASIPSRPA